MGKSTINGQFSMAMLNYPRVYIYIYICVCVCVAGPRAAHGAPEGAVDSPPTGDSWKSHGKMMGKMMEK